MGHLVHDYLLRHRPLAMELEKHLHATLHHDDDARPAIPPVGKVGLRKPHPRLATLTTFGPHTASVSQRNLHGTGVNKNANTANIT
jgi:hypothetical protein